MFSKSDYIYEIYKERSFSKAARNLHISQPALSAAVKKEEAELGMPLFDRSTKPIRLTECGERYIAAIQRIRDAEDEFYQSLNSLNNLQRGTISIGGSNLFASILLPDILKRYQKKYPYIQVTVEEASSADLREKLIDGTLDFAVEDNFFESTIFEKRLYLEEKLLLVVPKSMPVCRQLAGCCLTPRDVMNDRHLSDSVPAAPISAFKDCPFILLNEGNESRTRMDIIFNQAGIIPNNMIHVEQQLTAYLMACQGIGIATVCDTIIKHSAVDQNIRLFKVDEANSTMELSIYYKKHRHLTKAMEAFLEMAGVSLRAAALR